MFSLELFGSDQDKLAAIEDYEPRESVSYTFFLVYTFAVALYVFTYFSTGEVDRFFTIYFLDLPRFLYFYLSNIIHGRPIYSHYYISLTLIIYYYLLTLPIYFSLRLKKTRYLWFQLAIFILHFVVTISVWY